MVIYFTSWYCGDGDGDYYKDDVDDDDDDSDDSSVTCKCSIPGPPSNTDRPLFIKNTVLSI